MQWPMSAGNCGSHSRSPQAPRHVKASRWRLAFTGVTGLQAPGLRVAAARESRRWLFSDQADTG
jgi:hypothetical protein